MKSVLLFSLFNLCASVCIAQTDSVRRPEPSSRPAVQIPGIDTPLSGPGTLLQSSPNPNAVPLPERKGNKRRRTSRPTDPRAFGVAVPLGKARKDTLR